MYLQNHVQLVSGQTLLLPTSTSGAVPTLADDTTDTRGSLRANNISMPPHALPSYKDQDHISQHNHLPPQHPQLPHNTNTSLSTRTTGRNQTGSNRNFLHKPALIVINPGHISSDGPHDTKSNRSLANSNFQRLQQNTAILPSASCYHLSTEDLKGRKHVTELNVSSRVLDNHSDGAFHVLPVSKRSEESSRKSPGFSSSILHKPTLTVVSPPAVPELPIYSGKVEKFPTNQQYGRAYNGDGQKDEEGWMLQLQHQGQEGNRLLHQQQFEYIRALQEQEQQKYDYQRLLQNQEQLYQHRTLQHQKQLYEHQTLLQLPERSNQHQTPLQQDIQQQGIQQQGIQQQGIQQQGIQQQQEWKHQGLHHLEQQQHQNQTLLQQNQNQHMIPNHNETTSPFDMVTSSSRDHNSNQRHYQQHPNDHYPPPQQHHNLPQISSHLRTSAFSPTSSGSLLLSHLISETKPMNSNIPVILISSPPAQEQNRQHAGSPHSSALSPEHVEVASLKPRTSAATLLVPPSHTSHQRSRSANPPKSRPLNIYRPEPPPRPLNLSRPNPPPRPSNLRRSHSQPRPLNVSTSDSHSLRHVDFQPIDKPYNTHLDVDTPLDRTPPPEPPLRISSSPQLPPISVRQEGITHPLAVISPTLQKPASKHHDSFNTSSLERHGRERQRSETPQSPKCYLNSSQQEDRTPSSTAVVFISPTLQKPSPYLQDPSQTAPILSPSRTSSTLQLPRPHQDLLIVPQENNISFPISSNRLSPTLQSSPHHHREPSHKSSMEKPELPPRMSSSHQRPISYHGDFMTLQDRPQPPAPPTRISSTIQISPSHKKDLSRSLPSVIISPELSVRVPTLVPSQFIHKEDMNSLTPRLTHPCSTANARPSQVSRDIKQQTLATVEDLSNVKLKPIRDSSTQPMDLNPVSPGEGTTATMNYRLRSTFGKFSNIYTTGRTTLPLPPATDDLDELPPPPPPHELVLSPEDLAIIAADSCRPHRQTGSSGIHFPTAPAHSPAGRFQAVNMSNMDFEIPDDIDLSKCPGLVEITQSTPNWKRDMIEKKNQEKIEEYVKKIQKEREQEAKWKNVPEWKKKILQKKDEEETTGTSAIPETKTDGKNPEIKVQLKKATKKPPPPPPKNIKEDYSSSKPKGDFVSAALSIDPEELAAMPPWKRELLFKRDKVPVTFSNEFNPDEDSAADSDNTTS